MENELTPSDVEKIVTECTSMKPCVNDWEYIPQFAEMAQRFNALLRSKQQAETRPAECPVRGISCDSPCADYPKCPPSPAILGRKEPSAAPPSLLAKLRELRNLCDQADLPAIHAKWVVGRLDAIIKEAVSESENGQEH